jgi:hypothetical protein
MAKMTRLTEAQEKKVRERAATLPVHDVEAMIEAVIDGLWDGWMMSSGEADYPVTRLAKMAERMTKRAERAKAIRDAVRAKADAAEAARSIGEGI